MQEFELLMTTVEKISTLTRKDLFSKSRSRPIVELRMSCINILRQFDRKCYSVTRLSKIFGVDHSLISYYCKQHSFLMINRTSPSYKSTYQKLNSEFKEKTKTLPVIEINHLLQKKELLEKELQEIINLLKIKGYRGEKV